MTINEADTQPQAEEKVSPGPGPGETLQQAREAKGWTQAEVARRLNLRLAVIESIDSDHYKAGVALTFLRGYIKAYAKVVGVPEAQALAAFDSMSHEQFKAVEPMKSFSKKTRQQASDKWLKRISWLVFLGLLTSLVYWWWHDGAGQPARHLESENNAVQTETGLTQPVTTSNEGVLPLNVGTEAAAVESDVESDVASADTSALDGAIEPVSDSAAEPTDAAAENAVDGTAVDDTTVDNATVANKTSGEPAASATSTNARLLTLSFSDDCWIKITDSQGKVLSEGVKSAQQSLALEGEPPFKLILGVPTAVRAEYLGKAVDLSSFRAGRAARLTVPQS
ncbi:cytoskeleton protein RodZ [Oceanisphaera sp. IT1-181]|uniref:cytoskeleton protein RodZ n=1 Tax=Oceanisphaera sp. IT1-181 TaxID=3081199 RepID=UPI0029CA1EF6|nr:cytoskeleton protein RodZ [Oceanisphaera sp. IT1-181]